LEEVKELWVRLGLRDPDFPPRDMACFGCRTQNTCAYSEVRDCAGEKAIENCGLCRMYPCQLINAAFEKSEKLRCRTARVCNQRETEALDKAFFSKRRNLDQMHCNKKDEKKK
jgi:hypothetical protein